MTKRRLSVRWIGPIPYMDAFYVQPSGVFLVYAGQHLLYVGGGPALDKALGRHFAPGAGNVALDHTAREMLHYARNYRVDPKVKLGAVRDLDADAPVEDAETIADLVSLIVYEIHPPCNPYGRDRYEGEQSLQVQNLGKRWPLEATWEVEST